MRGLAALRRSLMRAGGSCFARPRFPSGRVSIPAMAVGWGTHLGSLREGAAGGSPIEAGAEAQPPLGAASVDAHRGRVRLLADGCVSVVSHLTYLHVLQKK